MMSRVWAEALLAAGHQVVGVPSADATRAGTDTDTGSSAPVAVSVICGAAETRAAGAAAALAAGLPVITESPLCATLAQADQLFEAAVGGAPVAAAHNLLWAPLVAEAVDRAAGLGAVHYVGAHATLPRADHRSSGAADPGGVLCERGPQVLGLILALCRWDTPTEIRATLSETDPGGADTAARVELRLASGTRCQLDLAWAGPPGRGEARFDVQLATVHSALRLELLPHAHLEHLGVDLPAAPRRWPQAPPPLEQFGYLDQIQPLLDQLEGRTPAAGSVALARALLDLVCAAYRSAGTGAAEPLPFAGPRELTPHQIWRLAQAG